MRTAIVSDLHLGSAFGEDLARDRGPRAALLAEVATADRVVLLGDAIELRELPAGRALDLARPFFEELGEALAGRPVVLVPGNHDHRLAEPLLEGAALAGEPLGLERRAAPAGPLAESVASWLGGAEVTVAYPGIWLRGDVYATHGHYMDCHMSLPRAECVAAATLQRLFDAVPEEATPGDYEQVLRPLYGFTFGLAQGSLARRATRPSERAWRRLNGNGDGGRVSGAVTRAAAKAALRGGVRGINRLLRSEFSVDLSPGWISRGGIQAATELGRRLRTGAAHVVTGHTHRAGPGEGEEPWGLPGGGLLHNTGSWVFASALHRPGSPPGPYWPGTVTWLDDEAPPRRVHLLADHPRESLSATVAELRSATR